MNKLVVSCLNHLTNSQELANQTNCQLITRSDNQQSFWWSLTWVFFTHLKLQIISNPWCQAGAMVVKSPVGPRGAQVGSAVQVLATPWIHWRSSTWVSKSGTHKMLRLLLYICFNGYERMICGTPILRNHHFINSLVHQPTLKSNWINSHWFRKPMIIGTLLIFLSDDQRLVSLRDKLTVTNRVSW